MGQSDFRLFDTEKDLSTLLFGSRLGIVKFLLCVQVRAGQVASHPSWPHESTPLSSSSSHGKFQIFNWNPLRILNLEYGILCIV